MAIVNKSAAQALQDVGFELKVAKQAERNAREIAIRYINRWVNRNPNYGPTREFYVKDNMLLEGHVQIDLDDLDINMLQSFLKEINRLENLK